MADSKTVDQGLDEDTDTAGETEEIMAQEGVSTSTEKSEVSLKDENSGSKSQSDLAITEATGEIKETKDSATENSPQESHPSKEEPSTPQTVKTEGTETPKRSMRTASDSSSTPQTPVSTPGTPSSTPTTPKLKLPFRWGINWKKGEKLEAMDYMEKWYLAKISDIDYNGKMILIHFEGWNVRYDEWLPADTDRIRPLTRHSDRQKKKHDLDFKIGGKVLAKWTDCKMYPAKIDSINKDGSYNVRFYDGFRKTLLYSSIRAIQDPKEEKKEEKKVETPEQKESKTIKTSVVETPKSHKPSPPLKGESKRRDSLSKRRDSLSKRRDSLSKSKGKLIVAGSFLVKRDRSNSTGSVKRERSDSTGSKTEKTPKSEKVAKAKEKGLGLKIKTERKSLDSSESRPATPSPKVKISPKTLVSPHAVVGVKRTQKKAFSTSGTVSPVGSGVSAAKRTKSLDKTPSTAPKEFKIEADHNMFKCVAENCGKSFRKESLLDSHIKYYHSDGEPKTPTMPAPRKRRKTSSICSSDSDHSVSARSKGGQGSLTPLDSGSKRRRNISSDIHIAMETTLPPTPEVVDPVIKEEVIPADLEAEIEPAPVLTPSSSKIDSEPVEDTVDIEEEDGEEDDDIAHCKCGFDYEEDLMIQCDVCLTWQHAVCFNITETTLPKKHICHVCQNPPGIRDSRRYIHEQEWFKQGQLPVFNFLPGRVSSIRSEEMQDTQDIAAEIHQLSATLHALKTQLKIIRQRNHPAVSLWKTNWDSPEDRVAASSSHVDEFISVDANSPRIDTATSSVSDLPGEKPVIETTADSLPKDFTSTNFLTRSSIVKEIMDKTCEDSSTESVVSAQSPVLEDEEQNTNSSDVSGADNKVSKGKNSSAEELRQCERNMLVHILSVQNEINLRLDAMDDKLSVLESKKGIVGNEDLPPSAPRLKRSLHNITRDLEKVKLMAEYQGTKPH
ncbi:PHD finger protein 20-like protein 1 isoform X1 [Patella vulgata]|uniref:PHD finger protein 20-like protein 1 isoform X1 n=2 Tax=Patella vulgata TaxID=6465 RepID=UPI00218051DF|nr:PHD finger protein 20-like protein 1 isoform X1 [Patella vulgata]